MSRQFRYRMAALVASGLIFGLPLLTNGTASAGQLQPGDRWVTFGAGMLGLSCDSRPNVEKMTVPAESTLRVINRTGHDARLELAGRPGGVIPENGAAEVLFRRGTTPVVLTPDCSGSGDPIPMLVTAVPSIAATLVDPAPGGSDASGLPALVNRVSGQSSASGPAVSRTRQPRARPSQGAGHGGSRDQDDRRARADASRSAAAQPDKATAHHSKDRIARTAQARDPGSAGVPPAGRGTQAPPSGVATGVTGDDALPRASATDPFPQSGEPVDAPAAEPVAAVGPLRTGRPIGLLGLTAVVCMLGVLTAAIRAIVSQRASRSNLA
ncbi:hypothetical protein Acy02nite_45800 [Actinoplanes cyaneus]|uniref:Uncharacterized protein n=1 Tax=Actinoplanes cyaneus TaxID=52696 RepID=A0A919IJ38_9ACTN|nr:hypothetical protein [Actinoplanes cyaneus]MCW2138958.1 hypothetical protein [Actinoplanes cyaneus]GID66699.1 hypothetical protein Acy02nite_45800 [Actinoplanes cyaneus]